MGVGKRPDFHPLLGPGRHKMTLMEIKKLCRDSFPQSDRRKHLFQKLEEFIQAYLVSGLNCEIWINGSFVTKKDDPSDVDVTVLVDHDVAVTDDQLQLMDDTNDMRFDPDVNAFAYKWLDRNHASYQDEDLNPALGWHNTYGVEHSEEWLKGFVVMRLRDFNV